MIRGSPSTSVVSLLNARRLSFARSWRDFLHQLAALDARRALKLRQQRLGIDPRVPQVKRLHRRQAPHRLAIGTSHRQVHPAPLTGVKPEVASSDREASDQPLEIPLKRARQRLVKIVDVEHQPPIRCCERTEVRQVSITAQLHGQAGFGQGREIRGHQVRGTAVERKRRDHHPSVADRDQLRHPRRGLFLQQLNRIATTRRRQPLAVHATRHLRACRLTTSCALRQRKMPNLAIPPRTRRRRRPCTYPRPAGTSRSHTHTAHIFRSL